MKIAVPDNPSLLVNNQTFQKYITDGIDVQVKRDDGSYKTDKVWLFDFLNPENNDFLSVNQFTVIEAGHNRRPDIVIFVNGLPLVVIELKSSSDEEATITKAYNQIQTYKAEIPSLFTYNSFCLISDGITAKAGTLTSPEERFMAWKTIDDTRHFHLQ